jgi:flagellum-specific peptidoglycan hydrolase FlgJ
MKFSTGNVLHTTLEQPPLPTKEATAAAVRPYTNPKEFIEYIADSVKAISKEFGFKPSICIAQACYESSYGTSNISRETGNFFGIKVPKRLRAKGEKHYKKFAYHKSSVRAYGEFVSTHYGKVRSVSQIRGYGSNTPRYQKALKDIIKQYRLERYD